MTPLAKGDVFVTVAIMSITFLTEVGAFILIGLLWNSPSRQGKCRRKANGYWWPAYKV